MEREGQSRAGLLVVITGPMFAGKTSELLRRMHYVEAAGFRVIAVKSSIDTRYHPSRIVAHTGASMPALAIDHPDQLLDLEARMIGIDEAHFFTEGFVDAVTALLDRGVDVICAGLDRTSFHVPIPEMGRLLCEADEIFKVAGECSICGEMATHTKRLVDDQQDVLVGGEGMFEPRCRFHRST